MSISILLAVGGPIRVYLAEPLPVGFISQFDKNGNTIISDGYRPFGVIGDMDENLLTLIHYNAFEFETTVYDQSAFYNKDDLLYCSTSGLLTNLKPFESSILLGKVIEAPSPENLALTAEFI